MDITELNYPILLYKEGNLNLYVYMKVIKTAGKELVEDGVFNDVKIIDSEGVAYCIKDVCQTGWGTFFMGYSPMIKGRLVRVKFLIERVGYINLSDFKELVLKKAAQNKMYYYSEILPLIQNARTYKEIITLFK